MDIIILLSVFGLIGFLVIDKFFSNKNIIGEDTKLIKLEDENKKYFADIQRLNLQIDQINQKNGSLSSELDLEKKERNEQIGKNKQMFAELTQIKEKNLNLQNENSELKKKVTKFETESERSKSELEKKVIYLENSRLALEDEKMRIRREDEERIKKKEEERDRIWNEHEQDSILKMREVCQKGDFGFNFFDNNSLPVSFDGSLKPDFLIDFLGQYMIFDAKMSRSENLQNYLNDQVKNTVKKIKASKNFEEIYNVVFFIVPTIEISSLKKFHYFEGGFNFFIVSIESFEPILSSYKKIREYDFAESFDPQERENIVNLIAAFDFHINRRNSIDIISSIEGLKISSLKNALNKDMIEQIDTQKKKIRIEKFKDSEMKRFISNPQEQIFEINKLITQKKAEISKDDFEDAKSFLDV